MFILHVLCNVYKNWEVNCKLLDAEHVYIKQYGTPDTPKLKLIQLIFKILRT